MALAASKLEIAKARRLWEANALPVEAMCRALGRSPPWLYHWMRKEGWKGRPPKQAPETVKPKGRPIWERSDWATMERKEAAAREYQRYGPLLRDVQLLRRRGFAVNCEGDRYRVGNALVDAAGLVAKADRERRLLNDTKGPHP